MMTAKLQLKVTVMLAFALKKQVNTFHCPLHKVTGLASSMDSMLVYNNNINDEDNNITRISLC